MSGEPLAKVLKLCATLIHASDLLIKITIIKQGTKKSPLTPIRIIYKMQVQIRSLDLESVWPKWKQIFLTRFNGIQSRSIIVSIIYFLSTSLLRRK